MAGTNFLNRLGDTVSNFGQSARNFLVGTGPTTDYTAAINQFAALNGGTTSPDVIRAIYNTADPKAIAAIQNINKVSYNPAAFNSPFNSPTAFTDRLNEQFKKSLDFNTKTQTGLLNDPLVKDGLGALQSAASFYSSLSGAINDNRRFKEERANARLQREVARNNLDTYRKEYNRLNRNRSAITSAYGG